MDKLGEILYVIRQKNRIMDEFFMALVAEDCVLAFNIPGADQKDTFGLGSRAILRTAKEPFCDEVVFGAVATSFSGGEGVGA